MDDIQAQPLIARLDQAQLVGVNITGGDAPPVLHGDSGGEGFASRGCAGVQHPPPRLRRGGQHRQMGSGILDVKVPLLERLQVFQTSGAIQEQAVRQPGMGFHCHPLGRQHGSQLLCGDFEGVYLGTGGRLAVVGGQQGLRLLSAQPGNEGIHQPLRMAVPGEEVGGRLQRLPLANQAAEHPVDQPCGPGIFGLLSGQGHRLADGGVIRHPVQIQKLIGPQAQQVADRRLQLVQRGGTQL